MSPWRARFAIVAWLVAACAAPAAWAGVDYDSRVKPLLKERCFSCHGAVKQEAGLRLDAASLIHKGSENGKVIVPQKSADSLLIKRVLAGDDERMPPKEEGERLSPEEVVVLKAWIDAGALIPPDEEILTDPRQHWTYQAPKKSPLETAADPAWSANPIDAILAEEHQKRGLVPAKPSDRALLLRRVTLDLTGLPPTPDEISAFLNDARPDAYVRVVDRLLESPAYGERWARHWMDVWRYSDWDGYKEEVRNSQRHIWRWRDWIIESLNADKGYDRMIQEMLAADEQAPTDNDALRATGFLARNYNKFNRDMWLDAAVEHTSKAFLGVSLNCARCHDHKYDPLPQTDYYAFRAIFEPYSVRTDRLPGEPDLTKAGLPRVYDDKLQTPTYLFRRGNEKDPDKDHPLAPAVPAALGGEFRVESVDLPLMAWHPALQDFIEREDVAAAEAVVDRSRTACDKLKDSAADDPDRLQAEKRLEVDVLKLSSLKARLDADRRKLVEGRDDPQAAIEAARLERQMKLASAEAEVLDKRKALVASERKVAEPESTAKSTDAKAIEKLKTDVDAAEKAVAAARKELEKTDGAYSPVGPVYARTSSGRRLALARWITSSAHPLTARVAVNQMWLRHFGTPLVPQVVDYGLNAPRPELIKLLDWLAVELMSGGDGRPAWSMKHLHRLIVTSVSYQLSSDPGMAPVANQSSDAANRFYWRANVRRLEGEVVRDCVLACSGTLDSRIGGPDLAFEDGEKVPRRSLYFQTAYEKQMLMLTLFDAANPADCYRRTESVIPQQALALSNSGLLAAESRRLAKRLAEEDATDDEFIREAFLVVLNRHATSRELTACLDFLDAQEQQFAQPGDLVPITGGAKPAVPASDDPAQRARENLVLVLFNHNDFVTVR